MNKRSFVYISAVLGFFAASNPAYAHPLGLGQNFSSFGLQSAAAVVPSPGINAVQSEYLVVDKSSSPVNISEYEQTLLIPGNANTLINSITALGVTYTLEDLKASLSKLKTKNVQASKEFLDNLLLADALLNEMRKGRSSVAQGVPGIASFSSPSVTQGVPGIASFSSPSASSVAPGVPGIPSFSSSSVAQGVPGIASFSSPVNLGAIEGTYRYEPYSNAWQEGTLEPTGDFRLKWTNKAKVSWGLTADLQTGILRKDEGSPYQDQPNGKDFIIVRDATGNVRGFQFQGSFYKKL